ncbi:hypothetical protein SDJN03_18126, partial [Cucurbita argyrosperma subsp. sororia]
MARMNCEGPEETESQSQDHLSQRCRAVPCRYFLTRTSGGWQVSNGGAHYMKYLSISVGRSHDLTSTGERGMSDS